MQLLQQVENIDRSHARTKQRRGEVAMGEPKDVHQVKNSEADQSITPCTTPQTFELKKNGYLALPRGLSTSAYETGLSSQVSGGIEIFGLQNRDYGTYGGDLHNSLRQSSIDTEPHTLTTITVRHAKDGAVEIIETYDQEEALHMFLKDAEDEHLREEAIAAILPVEPELVT